MSNGGADHLSVLTVTAWDVRANVEAQLRSLTSLQRCIDNYRASRDPVTLSEIKEHLDQVAAHHEAVREAMQLARESLMALRIAAG